MPRDPESGRVPGRARLAAIAWGATIVWLLIAALVYFGLSGGAAGLDPLRVMMVPVAVFGPVALVWMAALNAMRLAEIRHALHRLGEAGGEETARRLDAVLAGQKEIAARLSRGGETPTKARPAGPPGPPGPRHADPVPVRRAAPEPPEADEPAAPGGEAEAPAPMADETEAPAPVSGEAAEPAEPAADEMEAPAPVADEAEAPAPVSGEAAEPAEPAAGEAEAERPGVETDTLIAALQFPADPDDREGFRALRRASRDPAAAPVVTAAQDLLTLLSEDGIYMDDFAAGEIPPDAIRRLAGGGRGAEVSEAGAVRDEAAEARIAERLESDAIFRDTAQHFVRQFDHLLADLAPRLSDADLTRLAATRTGRAYMLAGRPLGIFG